MSEEIRFAIIGNGRLAKHLCHYFGLLNISYKQWYRSQPISTLQTVLAQSSHILILISDDAIPAFIDEYLANLDKKVLIHCSGALVQPNCHCAHPLQSFSQELYSLSEYKSIPFIIEADGLEFETLLPGLPNPHYRITTAEKPYYHAMCVMANNFTTLLWRKFFSTMQEQFGLSQEDMLPYFKKTLENIKNDPNNALTGPFARGDQTTFQKNLNALKNDSYQKIYSAFIDAEFTQRDNNEEHT